MEKRVLFIDDENGFISKSICMGLNEAGYETSCVKMDVSEIGKIENKPDLLFVYLTEDSKKKTDVLFYLRDLVMEDEKLIFLIGYPDDLNEVRSTFPGKNVGGIFERPINAKQIGPELDKIVLKSEEDSKKKHILVVDDSGTMLRTIKSWLEGKYRVSMVNSAVNAISFLTTNTPDLILLDYEMPVCSGPQMLQMIRSEIKTESIPVMFLTGKGDRESVQKVLSLKPQGYMLKSQSPDQIIATIDAFFASQKADMLSK